MSSRPAFYLLLFDICVHVFLFILMHTQAAWEGERHVLMTELQSTATSLERENICIKNIEKRLDATMDENNRLQQHVDSLEVNALKT